MNTVTVVIPVFDEDLEYDPAAYPQLLQPYYGAATSPPS